MKKRPGSNRSSLSQGEENVLNNTFRTFREIEGIVRQFGANLLIPNAPHRKEKELSVFYESPGGIDFTIPLNTKDPSWRDHLLRSLQEIEGCCCS